MGIKIITVDECVYDLGKIWFEKYRGYEGWSLTDAISFAVVKGLGQSLIVSADKAFTKIGLTQMPTEAYYARTS